MIIRHRGFGRAALALSTALAMAAPVAANAQAAGGTFGSSCQQSRISVIGVGQARIAPDMATIQLGVTTRATTASEAMAQNSTQHQAVIDALTAAEIEAQDIQTSGLNLSPTIDYNDNSAPVLTGYEVSNLVSVRVQQIDRLGEVLDAIVQAGANQINGIQFTREDGVDSEDQARRDAVEDARHKAEILAQAAGLTLGPVIVIRDSLPAGGGPEPMMRQAMAADAGVPVQPGEVAMNAQVEVEFALVGGQDCGPDGQPTGQSPTNGAQPVPGDVPPPMGTDTGAPEPGESVVPQGDPATEAPAN